MLKADITRITWPRERRKKHSESKRKTLTLRNKIVEFASGARRVRFFTYNLFVPGNDIF